MLLVGDAGVRLRPVADKFVSEADDEISRGMPGVAKKAAGFFAAAFAAVSIGTFLKGAVSDAVDLGENVSKVGVVFEDSAGLIEEFASTASTALGQSRNQALEAAGSFGTLFRGMGIGSAEAANLSTSLVTTASDMASFGNATPQEALDALRSGLIGETEPLRRFGVMLSAAAIEEEAVRLGLAKTGEELSGAAKAQATYSLIMAQTALQQGDFGRTSEGLANQQRIMGAQWTDLSTNVGGLFVPALANAAGIITGSVMPRLLNLTDGLGGVGDALGTVGDMFRLGFSDGNAAVNEATQGLTGLPFQIGQIAGAAGDLGAIFRESLVDGAGNSALLAEDSLQGLATRAGEFVFQTQGTLFSMWDGLREGLAPVIGPILEQVSGAFTTIGAIVKVAFGGGGGGGGLQSFSDLLASLAQGALPLIIDYFTRWADVVAAVIPVIVTVLQTLVPAISDIFAQIGPVLAQLAPIIGQVAGLFATTLVTVIQALAPVIPPLVAAIGQVASVLAGAFLSVLTTLAPVLPVLVDAIGQIATVLAGAFAEALAAIAPVLPVIATVIGQVATALAGAFAGALQAVLPVLPVIADVLGQVAVMFAGALATALQALLPILPPLVEALSTIAQVLIGALMGALQAILPILPTLINVFLELIMAAVIPLLPLLPMLANLIAMILQAVAPLIPPLLQLVMVIIQLVVAAIVPLLPFLPIVIGLFTTLIGAIMPIVGVLISIIGAFIGFASTVASVVIGFVSTVIGIWTSLWTGISGIVTRIVGGVTGGFQGLKDGIGRIFSGIADFVGGMFEGIGGAIKGAINAVIRGINNTVIGGINVVIDGVNLVNPFDDIPHVPKIPTFHVGGVVDFGNVGQGLALLRNDETVVTPEDRDRAAALLVAAAGGRLGGGTALAAPTQAGPVTIEEHIHQAPGEPIAGVAARVTQSVVWNLNSGITRPAPAGALP